MSGEAPLIAVRMFCAARRGVALRRNDFKDVRLVNAAVEARVGLVVKYMVLAASHGSVPSPRWLFSFVVGHVATICEDYATKEESSQ